MGVRIWYRSWTDEILTSDPGLPDDPIPVMNPNARIDGRDIALVVPLRHKYNPPEGVGGRVFAKIIADAVMTVTQNPHKPVLIEIELGSSGSPGLNPNGQDIQTGGK